MLNVDNKLDTFTFTFTFSAVLINFIFCFAGVIVDAFSRDAEMVILQLDATRGITEAVDFSRCSVAKDQVSMPWVES